MLNSKKSVSVREIELFSLLNMHNPVHTYLLLRDLELDCEVFDFIHLEDLAL